jgi:pimeloyl-ACP methyl ester carboxylesterase
MLSTLEATFDVGYIDRIGHDPRFPVTEGWPHLVDELIATLESRYADPVLGVGHSLGGFLTAIAAARRPDLFRSIILLDAPVLAPFQGSAIQLVKRVGLIDRVTPAGATKNRRREWSSREEAITHFKRRKIFRNFDPACFMDYVTVGLVDTPSGVELWFDPSIEYQIYRTMPHNIAGSLKRLAVPGGFIAGRDSTVLRRVGLGYTRKHFRLSLLAGGHLFPFQIPEMAAIAIQRMARDLHVV